MILELIRIRDNRLSYQVKYSIDICSYFEEDNIVGTYSKDLIEILEILRILRNLPFDIRENIVKRILVEEYKHIFILNNVSYILELWIQIESLNI